MRFRELRLTAFGPFTGQTLKFGAGRDGDFHVVVGPNEAGKTSLLRAINALLFGVPGQTKDDFLHSYAQIRVGALLDLPDATQFDLTRVKANVGDLRGPDGEPISDQPLRAALGGMDASLYSRLFLVSHQELREGGQGLAAGGGDYGVSVFGATLGSGNLAAVRSGLEKRAAELFSPKRQARNPKVNAALAAYRSHLDEAKERSVKPRAYEDLTARIKDVEATLDAKRQEVAALEQNVAALTRLRSVTSPLARLAVVAGELKNLADAPALSANARTEREVQTERLARAEYELEKALGELAALDQEIDAIPVDERLLEHAPQIKTLEGAIQRHEAALSDRNRRERELADTDDRVQRLRTSFKAEFPGADPPGSAQELPRAVRTGIEELGDQEAALRQRERDAAEALRGLTSQLTEAQRAVDQAVRPAQMPATVVSIVSDLESGLHGFLTARDRDRDIRVAIRGVESQAAALTPGVSLVAESLTPPTLALIGEHAARVKQLDDTAGRMVGERDALKARIETLREQLAAAEAVGIQEIGEKLRRARGQRDETLNDLGAALDTGEIDSARASHGRLAPLIQDADSLADAQLAQADAIRLRNQIGELARQLDDHEQELGELNTARMAWRREWADLWAESGFPPPAGPADMLVWRERYDNLRERYDDLQAQRSGQEELLAGYRKQCERLVAALADAGHPVADGLSEERTVAEARSAIDQTTAGLVAYNTLVATLAATTKAHEQALAELQAVKDDRAAWTARWQDALTPLPIAAETSVPAARQAVSLINEIAAAQEEAAKLAHRIQSISADFDRFAKDARAVAAQAAPDIDADDPLVMVRTLAQRLEGAQKTRGALAVLNERRAALVKAIGTHRDEIADAQAALDRLTAAAGCRSVDELPDIERRAERRAELERERTELERQIVEGGQRPIDRLKAELAGRDGDQITAELNTASDALDTARDQEKQLIEARAAAEAERRALDHGSQAAAAREAAEASISDAAVAVEQYLSEKAAAVLLMRAIDYHREHSATPVLDRAQELLPQLTAGSLTRLFVDDTRSGKPVLLARRADGASDVGVDAMSDGTLDQLYLALRLAALEHHLQAARPLPVLLDDVLVHYDEERVAAALPALASVGRRTQVIMLTHHQHVADIAREVLPDGAAVHSLTPGV
ncbi:MAG: AAA family ATPase [Solirubrobacteraceae bacterium]